MSWGLLCLVSKALSFAEGSRRSQLKKTGWKRVDGLLGCEAPVLCWEVWRGVDDLGLRVPWISPLNQFFLISAQARRPAEFKHIIKRRKRN